MFYDLAIKLASAHIMAFNRKAQEKRAFSAGEFTLPMCKAPKVQVKLLFSTNHGIVVVKYTKAKVLSSLLHEKLSLRVCRSVCIFKSSRFFLHTFFDF